MKLRKYLEFIKEEVKISNYIPTYEDCVEICSQDESPFYETKLIVCGFPVSVFNYRMSKYSDFITPIPYKPNISAIELRGITFVFNTDGKLFQRYVLLEKFFNLNQVSDTLYSVVKNWKIKSINNKEDGSIASFIKLPSGKVIGKTKMGFDNDQANGINEIYNKNEDINKFVNWSLNNGIVPIFEYVSPQNKIVLRYSKEELILIRLREIKTGKHIDISNHLDKIGSIRIAPFEDDNTLDGLIERSKTEVEKEGWIIRFQNDKMLKIKTDYYCSLHGLLTEDVYREHVIIKYILDDKIDDILGKIPEEQLEVHQRINKIISIVKSELSKKISEIERDYNKFIKMDISRKEYALNHRIGNPNFNYVLSMLKGEELKVLSKSEILDIYDDYDKYESVLIGCTSYELAKSNILDNTRRLLMARDWLKKSGYSLSFVDIEEEENN